MTLRGKGSNFRGPAFSGCNHRQALVQIHKKLQVSVEGVNTRSSLFSIFYTTKRYLASYIISVLNSFSSLE